MRSRALLLFLSLAVAAAMGGAASLLPGLTRGKESVSQQAGAPNCLPPEGDATASRWIDLAPLRAPRQEVAVAELDGRVFVIGGFTATGGTSAHVDAFDPGTDTWQLLAPLPMPLHHASAATAGGRLFVVGGMRAEGSAPTATTFEYDAAGNAWIPRASMPTARGALGVAVLDGQIYAAGGSPPGNERDFAMYDPTSDSWKALPAMPTARNHLAAAATAGRFYAVGGRSGSIGGITSALEVYDPATDTWGALARMPTPRGGIAATAVGSCLYVLGGEGNPAHPLGIFNEVEVYDPTTDTWRQLAPMAVPRHGIGATALGNVVYVPGGATIQGFGATDLHQALELGRR